MALPDDCGTCLYWQEPGGLCQRHAPGPGQHRQEIAFWPVTARTDRCGSGSDGDDPEAARVACGRCIHWHQPGGEPMPPAERRGIAPDGWGGERVLHPLRAVAGQPARASNVLARDARRRRVWRWRRH